MAGGDKQENYKYMFSIIVLSFKDKFKRYTNTLSTTFPCIASKFYLLVKADEQLIVHGLDATKKLAP